MAIGSDGIRELASNENPRYRRFSAKGCHAMSRVPQHCISIIYSFSFCSLQWWDTRANACHLLNSDPFVVTFAAVSTPLLCDLEARHGGAEIASEARGGSGMISALFAAPIAPTLE